MKYNLINFLFNGSQPEMNLLARRCLTMPGDILGCYNWGLLSILSQCVCVLVIQSCPTLCNCSLSGCSVHGILQARLLEWVAIPFSRRSSPPGDRTWSLALRADSFPSEPPGKPHCTSLSTCTSLKSIRPDNTIYKWQRYSYIYIYVCMYLCVCILFTCITHLCRLPKHNKRERNPLLL